MFKDLFVEMMGTFSYIQILGSKEEIYIKIIDVGPDYVKCEVSSQTKYFQLSTISSVRPE